MFRSKKGMVAVALIVAVMMTIMTPLAMACDTGGNSGGKTDKNNGRGYNVRDTGKKPNNQGSYRDNYGKGHLDPRAYDAHNKSNWHNKSSKHEDVGPPSNDANAGPNSITTPALTNANRMLNKAVYFWAAAAWLNGGGYRGRDYDITIADLIPNLNSARYMLSYGYGVLAAGDTAGADAAANEAFINAEFVMSELENRIHAVGRSVGEYKNQNCGAPKPTLVFGSDAYVCYGAAFDLAAEGKATDVYIDTWLTSISLCKYGALVFDPEYRLYGAQAHTGFDFMYGRYGGLSPEESAYLESYLKCGKLGLVYFEPYPAYSEYTAHGQIPFISVDFLGSWVSDPLHNTVVDAASPIAAGVPPEFDVSSHAEWDTMTLTVTPGQPLITNNNVVYASAGPTVTSFKYGCGRVVLTAFDTMEGPDNLALGTLICNAVDWVRR